MFLEELVRMSINKRMYIIIFIFILLFLGISIHSMANNVKEFKAVDIDKGYVILPKRVVSTGTIEAANGVLYVSGEEYAILAIENRYEKIDKETLDYFNISEETIGQTSDVDSIEKLKELMCIKREDVIDEGYIDKPNYKIFSVNYSVDGETMLVNVYKEEAGEIVEFVKYSAGYFSEKETDNMRKNMGFSGN